MATLVPRSGLLLRPKSPMEAWLKGLPDAEAGPLPSFKAEPMLFLIPDMDSPEEVLGWIEENYDFFFMDILGSWWTDAEAFPKDRTFELFKAWFDMEALPLVEDACQPIAGPENEEA